MSYCDWHVGMKVVCIRESKRLLACESYPTIGTIYTLRSIFADDDGVFVRLREIRNPVMHYEDGTEEMAFDVQFFRPVQPRRTDISVFTSMLTGAKEREPA